MSDRSDRPRRRPNRVSLYLSDDELALIDAVAKRARRERPDWMRLVLLDAARSISAPPSAPDVVDPAPPPVREPVMSPAPAPAPSTTAPAMPARTVRTSIPQIYGERAS